MTNTEIIEIFRWNIRDVSNNSLSIRGDTLYYKGEVLAIRNEMQVKIPRDLKGQALRASHDLRCDHIGTDREYLYYGVGCHHESYKYKGWEFLLYLQNGIIEAEKKTKYGTCGFGIEGDFDDKEGLYESNKDTLNRELKAFLHKREWHTIFDKYSPYGRIKTKEFSISEYTIKYKNKLLNRWKVGDLDLLREFHERFYKQYQVLRGLQVP